MRTKNTHGFLFPMIVMSVLFFMVGFITTMNNSLIDFLSSSRWMLTFSEKQLINTAFYGAYIFSIPLSLLLNKMGYKPSAVISLAIIGLGFLLVFPAVTMGYGVFLAAMFLVALGIALLQIVLNPYVLALGAPETAASRLNLTGFLNSVATVIAPIFVGMMIANGKIIPADAPADLRPEASNVQGPFLIVAGIALALFVILYFLKLPEISEEKTTETGTHYLDSPFKYPHLIYGALGIFFYMGVEIGIPSFLPDRAKALGLDINVTQLLSFYWGGLMVGRLLGSVILQKVKARTALLVCTVAGATCLAASLLTAGMLSVSLLILTGLCHSIMWANIFNLASEDLGPHTKRASGIICSAVIGGALLPPMMGGIQQGFGENALTTGTIAALCCLFVYYAYIALFAGKLSKIRPQKVG
jgi:MFS transporter, FHS family, L-fucose permease